MTAIAVTTAQAGEVHPQNNIVISVRVIEAVTVLEAAYQAATGFGIADANGSGKQQFRGIYMNTAAAGDLARLLIRGAVYGFTVSALDGDAPLYLSDTVGDLDTAAGTMTVVCGRVLLLPDNATKVAYIDAQWAQVWA
jgi:hypothetical protein